MWSFSKPREHCAVVGAYSKTGADVAVPLYKYLYEMWPRGEEGCGIVLRDQQTGTYRVEKRPAAIYDAFTKGEELAGVKGDAGVGQNRYRTAGEYTMEDLQPIYGKNRSGEDFYLCHNGTIKNYHALRRTLEEHGVEFSGQGDTEVIVKLVELGKDIPSGLKIAANVLVGSYSLTILTKEGVYAVRDPHGTKPLAMGRDDKSVYIVSESGAFVNSSTEFVRDIERGEIFFAGHGIPEGDGIGSIGQRRRALDIFELIYFALPYSIIDGIPVANYRLERGRRLARKDFRAHGKEFFDNSCIAIPVPDSGRFYALGYQPEICKLTGKEIRYVEGLIRKKNPTGERSFTQGDQRKRNHIALTKLAPVASLLRGYRVFWIDDSIVRGVTSAVINKMLRGAGASEAHARSGYAEVVDCCPHGGIDMKLPEEQAAVLYPSIQERARVYGHDTMLYNDIADLVPDEFGADRFTIDDFCTYCIDHRNPYYEEPEFEKEAKKYLGQFFELTSSKAARQ